MGWSNGEWFDDGSTFVHVTNWCPKCPGDPPYGLWEMHYCGDHWPDTSGDMDKVANTGVYLMGSGDAGGMEQTAMCRIIHRNSDEQDGSVR